MPDPDTPNNQKTDTIEITVDWKVQIDIANTASEDDDFVYLGFSETQTANAWLRGVPGEKQKVAFKPNFYNPHAVSPSPVYLTVGTPVELTLRGVKALCA